IDKLLKGERVERNGRPLVLNPVWAMAAQAREKGLAFEPPNLNGCLVYSRKAANLREVEKDKEKKYEYFVLTRDPEPGKEITGEHLIRAREGPDEKGKLAIHFAFDAVGANLFRDLTSDNKPAKEGGFLTHLAIVYDGAIVSAPVIQSVISNEGQITGNF